jgi:hypothetical protein
VLELKDIEWNESKIMCQESESRDPANVDYGANPSFPWLKAIIRITACFDRKIGSRT